LGGEPEIALLLIQRGDHLIEKVALTLQQRLVKTGGR
jgi:hypothetical protein